MSTDIFSMFKALEKGVTFKMDDTLKKVNDTKGSKNHQTDSESNTSGGGDENQVRGNWSNQVECLLSLIGYAVGLGNLWRFPYLCMRNGGGAFLIPYFTFLVLCGIPLFFVELSIGQFSSLSPIEVWKLCPLFKGLGWGMIVISSLICIYYNVIVTWILYYLGKSLTREVPWAHCDHDWNTEFCFRHLAAPSSNETNGTLSVLLNSTLALTEAPQLVTSNFSSLTVDVATNSTPLIRSPAEEFWEFNVLQRSLGIDYLGTIRWELLLCLIAAWTLVFLVLVRGIKSSGKVVYVTATFPYIFLTCLLIRGLLLPGSIDGIKYYLYPDFKRLIQFKTWGEACLQIFYSLGPAWGTIITMSSYNRFKHNCLRDALIIPLVNCGTSFYAGFVIFSILGFMAKDAGLTVEEVVTSGPGLVFIAYPEAIARMPLAPLWAVMFFVMLLNIGLGSQFAMFEALCSSLVDQYPKQLTRWKPLVTFLLCLLFLLMGLPFITEAGLYFFQILDWYCAMFSALFIAFMEAIVVCRIYGWERFCCDVEMMVGVRPGIVWKVLLRYVTPILMASVLVFSCTQLSEPTYGDYTYPRWAIVLGWFTALISIIPVPLLALVALKRQKGSLIQRFRKAAEPAADWGPALDKYRQEYICKLKSLKMSGSADSSECDTIV